MSTEREGLEASLTRVRAAEGPSREIEIAVFRWLNPEYAGPEWQPFGGGLRHVNDGSDMRCQPPPEATPGSYTASLDAAHALVAQMLPDRRVHLNVTLGGTLEARASMSVERMEREASAHLMRPDTHPTEGFSGYVMEGALECAVNGPLAVLAALLTAKIAEVRHADA